MIKYVFYDVITAEEEERSKIGDYDFYIDIFMTCLGNSSALISTL